MPISLKNMRGCASPASTAICTSTTDHRSMIRHRHHHRRLNSYLHDQYSNLATNAAPCIAELPIPPRRKSSVDGARRMSYDEIREYLRRRRSPPGSSSRLLLSETASFREENYNPLALVISEPVVEEVTEAGPTPRRKYEREDSVRSTPVYRLDPGGSRALARVKPRLKESTSFSAGQSNQRLRLPERGSVSLKSSSSVSPAQQQSGHQVVVLRVSLHCKGCVGKLRKHLSKLEGVTSFSIDLETKRVMVVGSMSPAEVLTSISKVKNAQFWPSPSSTSASSLSSLSSSGLISRSELNSV